MQLTAYYAKLMEIPGLSRSAKMLAIMNFTAIFLLVCCLEVSAHSWGQKLTLVVKDQSLEHVFREIKKQTGYNFIYGEEQVKQANKITLNLENASIAQVLNACFKDQPLIYMIMNNNIIIKRKNPVAENGEIAVNWAVVPGIVTDAQGAPLKDASVKNLNSKKITTTNKDGMFVILASIGDVLEVSSVGYQTAQVKVTGESQPIKVSLNIAIIEMNDMVVVGYGSVRRKDLTGSVSSVNTNEIKNVPFVSVDNALVGKAPGVQVIKADGSPGGAVRIRIRGGSSLIGANDPLYIIDGVPVTVQNKYIGATDITNPVENYGGENARNSTVSQSFMRGLNNLAGLNIDDIESIDILKDASATAIYGSKAANGVVIINTKKGKTNQKPILEVNYYAGVSNPRKLNLLNTDQYKMILKEAAKNRVDGDTKLSRAQDPVASSIAANPDVLDVFGPGVNTDWQDMVLRKGFTQNANISVRGGGTGSRYYTSLAYTKQTGTLIGTDFSRISGKVNLDNEITKRLRVISNIDYGFTVNNITNGVYANALLAPPNFKPFNEDGSYVNFDLYNKGSDFGLQNPMALGSATNRGKNTSLIGSLSLEYDILKDLRFKSTASVNYSNYKQLNYIPSYLEIANPNSQGGAAGSGGVGSQSNSESVNRFFENTLTWNKEFNADHRLNLLTGTSWEKFKSDFFSAEGRGFPDDNFLNNLNSATLATQVQGSNPLGQNALLSFYARANYSFKDRYLVTFTGRSDISSKFAEGRQSGYFPSGALAWKMSEEKFLKGATWIDELKIRVSAGYTGSQSIADNMFRTLYTPTSYAGGSAVVPTQLGNDQIKWERTLQKDAGIDFSFFSTRLRGTIGYYNKTTKGLLLNVTPAPSYAYSSVVLNVATIRNKGLEIELRGDIVKNKSFQWNTAFNISWNRSKVLNVNGGPFSDPNARNSLNLGTSIVREGDMLGLLYGRVALGIFTTQKEIDDYKARALQALTFNRYLSVGDLKYDTVTTALAAGGTYANTKQDVLGKSVPDFFGGFTNIFSYRNFNLITLFTFSYGNSLIYQLDNSDREVINIVNKGTGILGRWTPENPSTSRERLIYGITSFRNNFNVYDASYIKLKSATISYDIPRAVLNKVNMNLVSVYFAATNLLTITDYPGLDPEVSDNPYSIIGGGRDISSFPTTREFTFGVRIGL